MKRVAGSWTLRAILVVAVLILMGCAEESSPSPIEMTYNDLAHPEVASMSDGDSAKFVALTYQSDAFVGLVAELASYGYETNGVPITRWIDALNKSVAQVALEVVNDVGTGRIVVTLDADGTVVGAVAFTSGEPQPHTLEYVDGFVLERSPLQLDTDALTEIALGFEPTPLPDQTGWK